MRAQLLTPVQEARMCIEAAPYSVDVLALANQVRRLGKRLGVVLTYCRLAGIFRCIGSVLLKAWPLDSGPGHVLLMAQAPT